MITPVASLVGSSPAKLQQWRRKLSCLRAAGSWRNEYDGTLIGRPVMYVMTGKVAGSRPMGPVRSEPRLHSWCF
jgi:hypothetical protein